MSVAANCRAVSTVKSPKTSKTFRSERRRILRGVAASPLLALPDIGFAQTGGRALRFAHAHTGEKLQVEYWENGAYLPDALNEINFLMRDFRSGEVFPIDPQLLDVAHRIQVAANKDSVFTIFSAYRSPATNEKLRQTSSGVAKKSFHMQGKALDIRLDGVSADRLHRIAVNLKAGGAGLYRTSGFIHVDVGPVRQW